MFRVNSKRKDKLCEAHPRKRGTSAPQKFYINIMFHYILAFCINFSMKWTNFLCNFYWLLIINQGYEQSSWTFVFVKMTNFTKFSSSIYTLFHNDTNKKYVAQLKETLKLIGINMITRRPKVTVSKPIAIRYLHSPGENLVKPCSWA